jgi:hypothetical protein
MRGGLGGCRLLPAGGFKSPAPHRRSSGTPVKPWRVSHNTPHQGVREIERRRRQIERAQAKARGDD